MLSDSRSFSRKFAAFALVAAPVIWAIGTAVDPAWSDDTAEYLTEVADNEGLYLLAGALWSLGGLLFVVGLLGLMRLVRGRRVTLGQIGVGLMIFGSIGMSSGLAFNGFEIAMATEDNREAMVTLSDNLEDSAALAIYWLGFFIGGIVLGALILAIALFRSKIVPVWAPILLIVSIVFGFVAGDDKWLSALSFVVLVAAVVPLAQRMLANSDDAWERWVLPAAAADRHEEPDRVPAGAP